MTYFYNNYIIYNFSIIFSSKILKKIENKTINKFIQIKL